MDICKRKQKKKIYQGGDIIGSFRVSFNFKRIYCVSVLKNIIECCVYYVFMVWS